MYNTKSSYVSPAVTVVRMESAVPLAASVDSYDKGTDETIKGEESLSRENGGTWEDDDTDAY